MVRIGCQNNFSSNTEKGDFLRDAVFSIVKTAHKLNVDKEKEIAGKKVDVYYEELNPVNRGVVRYGVECKYYGKHLDRTDYDRIIATYTSPFRAKKIDYLIIVTDLPPTSGVLESINQDPNVVHKSFDQFMAMLMDFSLYLRSVQSLFENEGLREYYVPILDTQGNDIETRVCEWLVSDDPSPLAILAGYGMGKTSFALKIASDLANKFFTDGSARIPIYLKLGDIFNEQGLEGLVCKYFASKYNVPGFSFPLFVEFNRLGHFLIVLDGFDEMKHAMSFSAFRSNLKEFNTLVTNKSKVIILGRPNAFTSEDEKTSLLRGIKNIGDKEISDAEMRRYIDVDVGLFTNSQIRRFIETFVAYSASQEPVRSYSFVTEEFCSRRIKDLCAEVHQELISRPVHARMLVLIALATEDELSSFSTYALYREFFERIMEREVSRPARSKIAAETRLEFVEKLAWERWLDGGDRGFTYADVRSIQFEVNSEENTRDDITRELIIGSVVEKKGDNYFYFAHRSFQEYLVAEHILKLHWTSKDIIKIDQALAPGVIDFIVKSGRMDEFFTHLLNELISFSGELSATFINFIVDCHRPMKFPPSSEGFESPWHALLTIISCAYDDILAFQSALFELFRSEKEDRIKIGLLLGLSMKAVFDENNTEIFGKLLLELFHWELYSVLMKVKIHKLQIKDFAVDKELDKKLLWAFLSASNTVKNSSGEVTNVEIDLVGFCYLLAEEAKGYFSIKDPSSLKFNSSPRISIPVLELGSILKSRHALKKGSDRHEAQLLEQRYIDDKSKVTSFWRSSPGLEDLVSVIKRPSIKPQRPTLSLRPL